VTRIDIGLNAVIVAVTEEVPRILTVRPPAAAPGDEAGPGPFALPFDRLDPGRDRTLELALRQRVREQTGLDIGYAEQLYTFGDLERDPLVHRVGVRMLSVAYLALLREATPSGARDAGWRDVYRFLPWEDWREGRPEVIAVRIEPALAGWVGGAAEPAARRDRRERADITFGLGGVAWDGERVLERYELLYEAGLMAERRRDLGEAPGPTPDEVAGGEGASGGGSGGAAGEAAGRGDLGRPMALDHRRILATALGRLRGKLRYRPGVFELLAPTFTLLGLQRVVEALAGVRLHKQNFRRLVERGGLVEGTGRLDPTTGGRPAELFRFRREVLRERPAPGVGLPASRR
jgi:hypothetical protein